MDSSTSAKGGRAIEKPSVETVNEEGQERKQDLSSQELFRAHNDDSGASNTHSGRIKDMFLANTGTATASSFNDTANADGTFSQQQNPKTLPRHDNTSSAMNQNYPQGHRRTASALKVGDNSMGANPHGPTFPKPHTVAAHKRQVSWGLENNTQLEIDSSGIPALQQPDLANEINFSHLPYFHPSRGGSGRISLEELRTTRPMEAEAEQYLIRALESREALEETKPDSSSAVLSNIPQEDLEALMQNPPDPDQNSVESHGNIQRIGEQGSNSSRTSMLRREKSTRLGVASPVRHRRTQTVSLSRKFCFDARIDLKFTRLTFCD